MPNENQSDGTPTVLDWDIGIGNSSCFCIAHFGQSAFHFKHGVLTAGGVAKIKSDVFAGKPPKEAMGGSVVPYSKIVRLVYSTVLHLLEIHYGGKRPIVVHGKDSGVDREVYLALRARVAPGVAETLGTLSASSASQTPLACLLFTGVLGGLMIWWSTIADPTPENTGRRRGIKNAIDIALANLGVGGTSAIVGAVAALFLVWLVVRVKNPPRALVIEVPRRTTS